MRILFCDDDKNAVDELSVAVKKYMDEHLIKYDITSTTSSIETSKNGSL